MHPVQIVAAVAVAVILAAAVVFTWFLAGAFRDEDREHARRYDGDS